MATQIVSPTVFGVERAGIRRAAVIGAGSMGGGIAAQFANAGIPVDLLDIPGGEGASRHAPAQTGIERQLRAGGFMDPAVAALVRPGNTEDDLARLADADWIVEAIIEDPDAKRALYARIDTVRKPGSIVSSNTSTIPRAALVEGAGERFRADFVITHFFNPPRVMRLVELVSTAENDSAVVERARLACETVLGKTVVDCNDTPGFIANRIGCYWMAVGVLEALRLGVTPEEADAVAVALGAPKTGVFGLLDLVGIDLVPHVWGSLLKALPPEDGAHAFDLPADGLIRTLIGRGLFGRKAKAGFYRLAADRSREVFDPASGDYRPERPFDPESLPGGGRDVAALVADDGRLGRYAWSVLSHLVAYTGACAPEIAADTAAVDTAIALGYAWRDGPFALAQKAGLADIVARLEREGRAVPPLLRHAHAAQGFFNAAGAPLLSDGQGYRAQADAASGVIRLAAVKAAGKTIAGNEAASLYDLGDGVACFEIHTKLNSLAAGVFDLIEEALARAGKDFSALVIGNDDPRAFSAGADLAFIAALVERQDWRALEAYIARGQALYLQLKYAPFPVVAAAHGFALGGGCELTLHADTVVSHAELTIGLPEFKVGIIPAWGGTTQLLVRAQAGRAGDAVSAARRAFDIVTAAETSQSARHAFSLGLLRAGDGIVMNRDLLLAAAARRAAELREAGYRPPEKAAIELAGKAGYEHLVEIARDKRDANVFTQTDVAIAESLARVLTGGADAAAGGAQTEEAAMRRELEALLDLAAKPETQERIRHVLATGKHLRN